MIKTDFIKKLASELGDALPEHLGSLKKDFEKNCQAIIKHTLNKFDLVTREEFDTQTKVLARTRKKLDEMDAQIKVLEESLKSLKSHGRKE